MRVERKMEERIRRGKEVWKQGSMLGKYGSMQRSKDLRIREKKSERTRREGSRGVRQCRKKGCEKM